MKNNNLWAKTLLSVYRYIGRITGALDKIFETKALNGNHVLLNNISSNNAFNLSNALINLIDRKITLINLKLIIERALASIDNNGARVLIMKYVENQTSEQVSKQFGFSKRTYFRKINIALESFSKAMNRMGYCENKLYNMLKSEKWIMEVYNRLDCPVIQSEDVVVDDNFICYVCSNLKQVSLASC